MHATPDLSVTLSNTRKLIKPGGKLVLLEITQNQWAPQIMFGPRCTHKHWILGN